MSIQLQVENRLKHIQKGLPFSIQRFYTLGSVTAVQKAMSRLVAEGKIVRVNRGVYSRPKPLKSLPAIKVTANAEQVARLWAKEKGFKLVAQGLEEAYKLGFQTQAPIRKVFWSNGPSREFVVGNDKVVVKTVGSHLLRWINRPEGALLRALVVMADYEVTANMLKTALTRLNIAEHQLKPLLNKLANSQVIKATNRYLHRLEAMVVT